MLRTLLAKAYLDPAKARRCFENWLDRCPTGIVTTFACAHGETAQDRPEGGLYLSSLLKVAHDLRAFRGAFRDCHLDKARDVQAWNTLTNQRLEKERAGAATASL
jgi:hypothetical protein